MEEDSREKLEVDILKYYTHSVSAAMWPDSANIKTKYVSVTIDAVLDWLDRQEAITNADWNRELDEHRNAVEKQAVELQAELAKRDKDIEHLKRKLTDVEERIETQLQTIDYYAEKLCKAQAIAEKYRADAIAAQEERDAYRDLCGRMRKMANEMMVMEVD